MPNLSIIVPTYNEEKLLEGAIERILNYMNSLNVSYEILICNNGSTDKSEEIAENLAEKNKKIKAFSTKEKGIGVGINLGIKNASGDFITYLHSDGEDDYTFIKKALELMEDHDIITGSRYTKLNSYWKKDFFRNILSFGAVFLTKIMIPMPITEIGPAKMFRKEWALSLLDRTKEKGWGWQLELLTYAKVDNLKIKEIPIIINFQRLKKDSKINFIKDGFEIFKSIIKAGLIMRYKR